MGRQEAGGRRLGVLTQGSEAQQVECVFLKGQCLLQKLRSFKNLTRGLPRVGEVVGALAEELVTKGPQGEIALTKLLRFN